jgi:hypothetical protein
MNFIFSVNVRILYLFSINQSSDKHSKTHTKNEKEFITSIWIFIFVIPLEKVIVLVVNHGSTRDSIGIASFSANHAALRSKSKDWLAWNQDNVSMWNDRFTCRLLFQ